ncbi:MAG TPA: transposase [Terracidiphilus sp.]
MDIASSSLAARIGEDGAAATFPNTAEGIAALAAFCAPHPVELVAMEATGGYEQQAFAKLSEHGLPVAVLNPRAVRQFAQSMGWLEKTDAIDAGMIAWYAATRNSRPACLAPQTQLELRARVTRLRQLTEARTVQKNRQRLVTNHAVRKGFSKSSPSWLSKSRNWNRPSPHSSKPTPCGASSTIRPSAPSKAWRTAQ